MAQVVTIRMAFAMIAFAVAAGVFVQYSATQGVADTQGQALTAGASQTRALLMGVSADGEMVFGLPQVTTQPVNHLQNVQSTVQVRSVYAELAVPQLHGLMATPVAGCTAQVTARQADFAMVTLDAVLPCAPDRDVTVAHDQLRISARTDAAGRVQIDLPALSVDAAYTVLVDNVEHGRTSLQVPDSRNYDRAILQWRDARHFQLHAFEPGAAVGDAGHIWSASVPDPTGQRGGVQRFGSADVALPEMAEVFTFPSVSGDSLAHYDLKIGVALTAQNCGRGVQALAFQVHRGGLSARQPVSAILPDCDAVGTIVMLDGQFGPMQR